MNTTKKSASKKDIPKKKKSFDEDAFCKKYPHVVRGSVKEAKVGAVVDGLTVVHTRICKIKCKESGKLRTIHTQDAHQVRYTEEIQRKKSRERAAERRRNKKGTSTKTTPKKEIKTATPKKNSKTTPKKNSKSTPKKESKVLVKKRSPKKNGEAKKVVSNGASAPKAKPEPNPVSILPPIPQQAVNPQ